VYPQFNGLRWSRVDVHVDIGRRNFWDWSGQGSQGRRSRGGYVWTPCLDGPGTPNEDTMDVAGRTRPAWMRLVLLIHQVGEEA
jgi:hypothetical protein